MGKVKLITGEKSDSQINLLLISTKLTVKDLEKITSVILVTLSETFPEKTFGTTEREFRITDSLTGKSASLSTKIVF